MSGVYDLVPLVNISVNDPLHMTEYVVIVVAVLLSIERCICSMNKY